MKNRRFLVLLCVSVQVLVGTVLAQQPAQHRATLIAQRKEIAKRYLAAAGLEPPEELDLAHLPQLRAEFNKFLSEPPQPPLSKGDQRTAAPDMHTETPNTNDTSKTVLDYLHSSPWNRFLRLPQFKAEALEQTKTVFIQAPDQPKPAPARNPDDILWKYSLSFNFSELSLSSADLATIYGAYGKL